ncbi:MAG: hypothetical protein ACK559_36735, partial [bacterium]
MVSKDHNCPTPPSPLPVSSVSPLPPPCNWVFFGAGAAQPSNRVKTQGGDAECGHVFLVNGSQSPV